MAGVSNHAPARARAKRASNIVRDPMGRIYNVVEKLMGQGYGEAYIARQMKLNQGHVRWMGNNITAGVRKPSQKILDRFYPNQFAITPVVHPVGTVLPGYIYHPYGPRLCYATKEPFFPGSRNRVYAYGATEAQKRRYRRYRAKKVKEMKE